MLSNRQVEAFRAVYVLRSMTRAAEALHISQPAVSRLVHDMEVTLQLKLFQRRKGGLDPTEEAVALYAEVERSFVGLNKIERAAARIREHRGGILRICAVPALTHSFLPTVIDNFLQTHSGVGVSLYTYDTEYAADMLRTRQFDVGYVMTPVDRSGVAVDLVKRVRCVCILPPGHRLVDRDIVRIEDLRDEPFISLAEGTMTRLKIDAAFQAANVTRTPILEAYWSISVCALVQRGLGVSIIEPFTADCYARQGGIIRPIEPAIDFSFVQIRQNRPHNSPLVTAFGETFDRAVADMCLE